MFKPSNFAERSRVFFENDVCEKKDIDVFWYPFGIDRLLFVVGEFANCDEFKKSPRLVLARDLTLKINRTKIINMPKLQNF